MKTLLLFIGWCFLFVLCWPVALLALLFFPLIWVISLPLRLLGITLEAAFALLRALLFLPARVFGYRKNHAVCVQ
jgi:hypothetical protein